MANQEGADASPDVPRKQPIGCLPQRATGTKSMSVVVEACALLLAAASLGTSIVALRYAERANRLADEGNAVSKQALEDTEFQMISGFTTSPSEDEVVFAVERLVEFSEQHPQYAKLAMDLCDVQYRRAQRESSSGDWRKISISTVDTQSIPSNRGKVSKESWDSIRKTLREP